MSLLFLTLNTYAQPSNKLAGQYPFGEGLLVLNSDSTFLLLGYATVIKGNAVFENSSIKLIPYKPEYPFVLYGRFKKEMNTINKLMFQGFNEAETLINYQEGNSELKSMKRVFNANANCIPYPNILNNTNSNSKFYFALKDTDTVYEFQNKEGYNDFIVLHIPHYEASGLEMINLNYKNGKLFLDGEQLKKEKQISTEEITMVQGMYDRAYSESANYYCNPAYNNFEENGIDLRHYEKKKEGDEYFFVDKYNDLDYGTDYHNTSIIYEYTKINPIVLKNQTYTIEEGSVFHYKCGAD